MAGKSRLIIQASLQAQLIIPVTFKSNNEAYHETLLQSIQRNVLRRKRSSFKEALHQNRIIMQKIRFFFMAYLDFTVIFQKCIDCRWSVAPNESKIIFHALLLNGGGEIVKRLFEKRLLALTDEDQITDEGLKTLKVKCQQELRDLLEALGNPWFALDECHVPETQLQGILFHSDYKNLLAGDDDDPFTHDQILEFQKYEQFDQDVRAQPHRYPYKKRTSLLSGIRFVCEEFLSKWNTMSIFSSTYFSCWHSLLDRSSYSRDKPLIQSFSTLHLLTKENIFQFLTDLKYDTALFSDPDIIRVVSDYSDSRPGFFYEHVLPILYKSQSKDKASLMADFSAAKATSMSFLERWLSKIHDSVHATFKKKEEHYLLLLQYLLLMHNSITVDQTIYELLVSSGLALKTSMDGKDAAIICEPLVTQFLKGKLSEPSFSQLEDTLISLFPSDVVALSERGLAMQILRYHNKPLCSLLESMGIELREELKNYLEDFTVQIDQCGSMNEFHIIHASDLFSDNSPLWRNALVLARTGISLPDLMLVVRNPDDDLCMLSIQVKAYSQPPANSTSQAKTFVEMVKNVSREHFFTGHEPQKMRGENLWKEVLKSNQSVLHIRILVCWAGFTVMQQKQVADWNSGEEGMNQPVFLVAPNAQRKIFGPFVFEKLCQLTKFTPTDKKNQKKPTGYEKGDYFFGMKLDQKEMPLSDVEQLKEALQGMKMRC